MERNKSNLAYLMSVFKMSSNELATQLNIHYSLVSKWKNNKRTLTEKSEYIDRIVNIFLEADLPFRYSRLKGILAETYKDVDFSDVATIRKRLKTWIVEQYTKEPALNFNVDDVTGHAVMDIYNGHEGKSRAISRLVDYAVALPPGQHLYIWKNQRMHSILEHREIVPGKDQKYREMLSRDGQITVVHAMNRKPQETFYSVLEMLPLHTTGKTEAYCEYNYSDAPVKYSIYLLEEVAASVSVEFADNKNSNTSYFITDKTTTSNIKHIYDSIKEKAHPLFDKGLARDGKKFQLELESTIKESGAFYFLTPNFMPFFMMESSIFVKIMEYNDIPAAEQPDMLKVHERLLNTFLTSIKKDSFRILLQNNGVKSQIPGCAYFRFADKTLKVSPEIFFEHVKYLDKLKKENPLLEILVFDDLFLPPFEGTTITVKENTAIFSMSTGNPDGISVVIKTPTLLDVFFYCLSEKWNAISPEDSNRKWEKLLS